MHYDIWQSAVRRRRFCDTTPQRSVVVSFFLGQLGKSSNDASLGEEYESKLIARNIGPPEEVLFSGEIYVQQNTSLADIIFTVFMFGMTLKTNTEKESVWWWLIKAGPTLFCILRIPRVYRVRCLFIYCEIRGTAMFNISVLVLGVHPLVHRTYL